jgi:hypothetical protein
VRLTCAALRQEQLLLTTEGVNEATVGFWQFESKPSAWFDSSPAKRHLQPRRAASAGTEARFVALADFCHALLNANEFLYVD